ncbi:hypothetical protein Aazo_1321 ['Nostoc azollae' 0708]|jgi:hypothetical protein|uniref:Uncharacterized protein n=1 Tax=Nostoc azollae (strain 0708) TaxID=551115 RepID=D7E3S1_NOSA0|nr:hypothetical protein Aazo_1321 ['Nostoc azollae' 0708]
MLRLYMTRRGNLLNTKEPQLFNSWITLVGVSIPNRDYLKFQPDWITHVSDEFIVSIPIRGYFKE